MKNFIKNFKFVFLVILLSFVSICCVACDKKDNTPSFPLTSAELHIDNEKLTIYGEVDNNIEEYNFNGKFVMQDGYSWELYIDKEGLVKVATNLVNLSEGNNLFYFLLTNMGTNEKLVYKVTIKRLRIYTISFDTNSEITINPIKYTRK